MNSATTPAEDEFLLRLRAGFFGESAPSFWLTRWVLLRGLGFIYCVAFTILALQHEGLIGSRGLLPAKRFVSRVLGDADVWQWPTLFYFDASDAALGAACSAGLGIALSVLLGLDSPLALFALWVLYLSFCHVGQIFWGYGWEILLLEAGFLAVWLCPLRATRSLATTVAPSPVIVWLFRWLVFRVMFGAGLIKLRGDECWRDLSCLMFHYETQPVPSPMSWLLHQAPDWFHRLGVLWNHLVELVVPFLALGPRPLRHAAGVLLVSFQLMLIVSGNLSFLNWLTIVVCLSCFDDSWLSRLLPRGLVRRARRLERARGASMAYTIATSVVALGLVVLSYGPVTNMLSRQQAMNTSFDRLHLVNSYGAFGSVSRERYEIVLEGTRDDASSASARWLPYALPCQPGPVGRRPCVITPYHYRLDWQMWFAALGRVENQPWLIHLVYKLLRGEPAVLNLFAHNPFEGAPPKYIRATRYRYRFTRLGEATGAWWHRKRVGEYLRPLSLEDPALRRFLKERGFVDRF